MTVGPRHRAEFLRPGDTGELHEIADRVLVGAPGAGVADIAEPLSLRRDVRQAIELLGCQDPSSPDDFGRQLWGGLGVVIAWRDDLAPARASWRRHGPTSSRGAVLAVRISLRQKRGQPQPGQRRQAAEGRERRRQDAGARRPPGPRAARPGKDTAAGKKPSRRSATAPSCRPCSFTRCAARSCAS